MICMTEFDDKKIQHIYCSEIVVKMKYIPANYSRGTHIDEFVRFKENLYGFSISYVPQFEHHAGCLRCIDSLIGFIHGFLPPV